MKQIRIALVFLACAALTQGTVRAGVPSDPANPVSSFPRCIARDTVDLSPTLKAPDWYAPGVTPLCSSHKEKGARAFTAYWIQYFYTQTTRWRTTAQNADYSAKDCEDSFTTCGDKIIYDADWFHATCTGRGLTKYDVARNIRYWADRARANGSNWRVYTFTEAGGYPYSCAFSVTAL
jgi:hypothetical protein